MKKIYCILVLSLFLGVGCISQEPTPEITPAEDIGTEPDLIHPPQIHLWQNEVELAGVEGSYCYSTNCVDKIPPAELIDEANLEYAPVLGDEPFTVTIDEAATEVTLAELTAEGRALKCAVPTTQLDATTYTIEPCLDVGIDTIISVQARFEEGDSVYYFPVQAL